MSDSEFDSDSPCEAAPRPVQWTWRAPEGAVVYGRDPGAAPPDDSPLLAPRFAPMPPPVYATPAVQAMPLQWAPPPVALAPPAGAGPRLWRDGWPLHIGPARTPDHLRYDQSVAPAPAPQFTPPPAQPPAPQYQVPPVPVAPPVPYVPPVMRPAPPPQFAEAFTEDPIAPISPEQASEDTLRSAGGLAWTALLVALLIPPVGIGLGWFCISLARREGVGTTAPLARRVVAISTAAMAVGVVSLTCIILYLYASGS